MLFPPSPREVYDVNPLDQVICQIRYPAVLSISANSPDKFQDAIRKAYPLYEERRSPGFLPTGGVPRQIAEILIASPVPQISQTREHRFLTESKARQVCLTQEFVAVTDYQYTRWEEFQKEIKLAERVLRETYAPAFYTRVGLRYVDVLVRSKIDLPSTPWSELFNPAFIGLLGDSNLADTVQELEVESLLSISGEAGEQVILRHGLARTSETDEQVYFIDADFYTERRSTSDDVFEALDRFNRLGGNLFRWATSDKLRAALGPTRI